jgi:hypothetical protein
MQLCCSRLHVLCAEVFEDLALDEACPRVEAHDASLEGWQSLTPDLEVHSVGLERLLKMDSSTVLPRNLLRYVGETFRTTAPTIASLRSINQRSQTLYKHQLLFTRNNHLPMEPRHAASGGLRRRGRNSSPAADRIAALRPDRTRARATANQSWNPAGAEVGRGTNTVVYPDQHRQRFLKPTRSASLFLQEHQKRKRRTNGRKKTVPSKQISPTEWQIVVRVLCELEHLLHLLEGSTVSPADGSECLKLELSQEIAQVQRAQKLLGFVANSEALPPPLEEVYVNVDR